MGKKAYDAVFDKTFCSALAYIPSPYSEAQTSKCPLLCGRWHGRIVRNAIAPGINQHLGWPIRQGGPED